MDRKAPAKVPLPRPTRKTVFEHIVCYSSVGICVLVIVAALIDIVLDGWHFYSRWMLMLLVIMATLLISLAQLGFGTHLLVENFEFLFKGLYVAIFLIFLSSLYFPDSPRTFCQNAWPGPWACAGGSIAIIALILSLVLLCFGIIQQFC